MDSGEDIRVDWTEIRLGVFRILGDFLGYFWRIGDVADRSCFPLRYGAAPRGLLDFF